MVNAVKHKSYLYSSLVNQYVLFYAVINISNLFFLQL